MISIRKVNNEEENQYFDFLDKNKKNLNNYYTNNNLYNENSFNNNFTYFLICNDNKYIGLLKIYFSTLCIKDIKLKCGGISEFSLLKDLSASCIDDILNKIDSFLEKEKYNLTFLNKIDDSYRKFNYWPIGTVKNFTITKKNMKKNNDTDKKYVVKPADKNDIDLLNEFYTNNVHYINRTNGDWLYLLNSNKYKYYICTNGEDISYVAYCSQDKSIVELHGDIACLNHTIQYIFDLFNIHEFNIFYNDIDFNITNFLYEHCKDINLSSIANMKIFNSFDTLNKLNYLINEQGYKFDNLSTEDEKEICTRILGFEYLPLNKYQFIKPCNVSFSIADLK